MKISFCTRHPVRKRFTRLNVCQTFTRKIARSCHVLALIAPAIRLRAILDQAKNLYPNVYTKYSYINSSTKD